MRSSLVSIVAIASSLIAFQYACAADTAAVTAEIHRSFTNVEHDDLVDASTEERDLVGAIYAKRQYRPLWNSDDQITKQARALVAILDGANTYGLRPQDYGSAILQAEVSNVLGPSARPQQWAQFDVALSIAAHRFLNHLHYGRVSPERAGFKLGTPHHDLDIEAQLEPLATADVVAFVAKTEPQFHHYALLKQALAKYRRLAADPTLTRLPAFTERSIKPGQSYGGAEKLRALLLATGDLPSTTNVLSAGSTLDPALSTALGNFQRRHGLTIDGALGKQTYAALTTPLSVRVRQIELTLERWRWLPEFESSPIIVNIPQFKLFAFANADDREENFVQMDVIVGRSFPHTRTPVFTGDMKYVVFRPYWDVPYDIMKREMLAEIRKQPGYLESKHLEIVRGQTDAAAPVAPTPENIDELAAGRLRLRQRPGPDNALGAIKFILPNSYNVYLHSTPEHRLFSESRRTFSHGCIRVSDPVPLAQYVLRNQKDAWPRSRIEAAMDGAPATRVNLDKPIRVMILYGTAVAADSGNVYFLDDVYGHDRKLEQLLGS